MPICQLCKRMTGMSKNYKNLALHLLRSEMHPRVTVAEYKRICGADSKIMEGRYKVNIIKKRDELIKLKPLQHLERHFKEEKDEWEKILALAKYYDVQYGEDFRKQNYEGWLTCILCSRIRGLLGLSLID